MNADPPQVADALSNRVKFFLPVGVRLHPTDSLVVSQSACGIMGSPVSLAPPVEQVLTDWPVDGPRIREPLVECQEHHYLENVLPGATVVVDLDGMEHRACFGYPQGWFDLPR